MGLEIWGWSGGGDNWRVLIFIEDAVERVGVVGMQVRWRRNGGERRRRERGAGWTMRLERRHRER